MPERTPCKDECAKYTKGIRQEYWCGAPTKHTPKDHDEHDWRYKGVTYHCYG